MSMAEKHKLVDSDGEAFNAAVGGLYLRKQAEIWRAVFAWSGSTEVSDEAVAEAFAQLLRRGTVVRDPEAWVWKTSFRIAAGELQRQRAREVRQVPTSEEHSSVEARADSHDELAADSMDLMNALACLSDQQRRCIVLVDLAGHSSADAAAILGTSSATIRVQLLRARRRLKAKLST